MNLLEGNLKRTETKQERIDTRLIPPRSIKQSHLESGLFAIRVGLSTDRPERSDEIKFWYSTDTNKLAFWTGSAWVESAAFA